MKHFSFLSTVLIAAVLTGCGSDDDMMTNSSVVTSSAINMSSAASMSSMSSAMSSEMSSSSMAAMVSLNYEVTVTNLTAGQPFSPLAITLHTREYAPFSIGMPASVGLEKIAEAGAASDYMTDANNHPGVMLTTLADGGTLPGTTKTTMLMTAIKTSDLPALHVSIVAMLGNTNDGFTGANGLAIGQLSIGESLSLNALSYDAGTEKNTESALTVPGPAAGGEGFNAVRDDITNHVTLHPGIVSMDDGNTASALTHLQRWDNPTARITIKRLAP